MDYKNIYNRLIERARNRILEGYTEKHHIVPRCIGGMDDASNLVDLTPEEHYVAHQLLVKIYPSEPKLVYAANMMTVGEARNNKRYGWLKSKWIETLKGRHIQDKTKLILSTLAKERLKQQGHPRGMLGKHHSLETKLQMSQSRSGSNNGMYGKHHTDETKEKLRYPRTDELRKRLSESKQGEKHPNYNKHLSAATRQRISNGVKNSIDVTCPKCGKVGKKSPMSRWHFTNCKVK